MNENISIKTELSKQVIVTPFISGYGAIAIEIPKAVNNAKGDMNKSHQNTNTSIVMMLLRGLCNKLAIFNLALFNGSQSNRK